MIMSHSCILSEILLHASQGIKWLNPLEKGPGTPAVPANLEIKNQEDKLVVQYFLSKHISELLEPTCKETENGLRFWQFKIQILSTETVCSSEQTVCYIVLLSGI